MKKPATAAQRKAAQRARQAGANMTRIDAWISPEAAAALDLLKTTYKLTTPQALERLLTHKE